MTEVASAPKLVDTFASEPQTLAADALDESPSAPGVSRNSIENPSRNREINVAQRTQGNGADEDGERESKLDGIPVAAVVDEPPRSVVEEEGDGPATRTSARNGADFGVEVANETDHGDIEHPNEPTGDHEQGGQYLEDVYLGEAWFWCFFFGIFGAHYFYMRNTKLGFLYLFTGGLAGLGYLTDLIRMPILFAKLRAQNDAKSVQKGNTQNDDGSNGTRPAPYLEEVSLYEAYAAFFWGGFIGAHYFYLGDYREFGRFFISVGYLLVGYFRDMFKMNILVKKKREEIKREYVKKYGMAAYMEARERNLGYKHWMVRRMEGCFCTVDDSVITDKNEFRAESSSQMMSV